VRRRRQLLIALAVVLLVVVALSGGRGADAGSHGASLAAVLAEDGLEVDPASLIFIEDEPSGLWSTQAVLFLASRPGEASELYHAEIRPGDGGVIHDVSGVTNLTRTSSADEQPPMRAGRFVLYASQVGDRFDAVTLVDTRGEPDDLTSDWPRRARLQNAVTNLQETGRTEGFGRRRYNLIDPADSLRVGVDGGTFVIDADGARVVIDPERDEVLAGAEHVELRPSVKGMPGTITWVVDTVRNVSWIGPAPIEWLEHRVFGVKDAAERAWHHLFGSDMESAEVAEDMGVTEAEVRRRLSLSAPDPELGWPPPPIAPVVDGTVEGEGQWIPVVEDPFAQSYPGAPPAFYQSFIRADPERPYTRVYVTVWDPRQVQLHIMTGTREPESATGDTGPGRAPRDRRTLTRLVAGFNGGFQALHGEFGMMAEGRVYLPPKPWAATVAVYDDGRVAMGSWRGPPEGVREYEERWATEQIPERMIGMRQNLTSVVEGDRFNPWERWWWGAAPLEADEQVHIDRSGLCLTEEGYLAYFWGRSMGPEALGAAMLGTRCVRGMHLDMNSRHTGFEFYNIAPPDEPHPPLGRAPTEDEYLGPTPDAESYTLRARKMVRSMTPMRFPRYVGTDPRDFFYLTLKAVLPGPPIPNAGDDSAGVFSTRGLPHAGWPHAFAWTWLGEEGARTWLVRIDPARALFGTMAAEGEVAPDGEPNTLAYLTHALTLGDPSAPHALYAQRELVGHSFAVGVPPEGARVLVSGPPLSAVPDSRAAIAVDREGFVLYAEQMPDDPRPLAERLRAAGAGEAVSLAEDVRLAFVMPDGALVAPDSFEREVIPDHAIPLVANERPITEVLWPEVEPMPYARWRRLQDSRVRYVREGPPRFIRGTDGTAIETLDAGPPP
jgi:hypothetical protein